MNFKLEGLLQTQNKSPLDNAGLATGLATPQ